MKRTQTKIKNPYTLSHRAMKKNGEWGPWIKGVGEWLGIKHVQDQIKMLKRNRKSRTMEFKLEYSGSNLDIHGNQIEGTFKLETR